MVILLHEKIPRCSSEGVNHSQIHSCARSVCLQHTQICGRVSCEWRAAVTRRESVRGEWHSNHLSLFLPLLFLPLSHFPAAVVQGGWEPVRFCATVGCYFPRLWDGGEKHTNNRINVILWDFGEADLIHQRLRFISVLPKKTFHLRLVF